MPELLEIFPTPVLLVDSVCLDHLDHFESIIKDIIQQKGTISTEFQNVKSTHQTFPNLYNVKQFSPLVEAIQKNAYDFLEILGFSEVEITKLRMNNMWANLVTTGDYLFPHIHSHSIVSGAYYI